MINKYKKFVLAFAISLPLLVSIHYIAWIKYTSHVLLVQDNIYTGDLGRMSLYPDSAFPRQAYPSKNSITLPKQHFDFNYWFNNGKKEKIDMLTIGDSFSNAATQGKNPFYQDYIASYNNFNILNITLLPRTLNYIESVMLLLNSGVLDEINPKYILIESVERFSIDRFAIDTNFKINGEKEILISELIKQRSPYLGKDEDIKFINDKNFTALKNNLLYNFVERPFGSKCYKTELVDDFFTSKDKNSLLYYKGDIDSLYKATEDNIKKLNSNFNKLGKILEKKGIKLIFMPAVDKYTLYSKFIIDKKHPDSVFFESLRKLDKNYIFIDTKKILLNTLINNRVKDLYYPDDTHWSFKAPEIIFRIQKF
ncbi:hypothetical protein [Halarcobacter sp.]|uniref:hypothetical protein n=1 Tax=Halarcobacter sp. TaxID=2321133 RepID=UPI002AA871D7|nr:hypothetical protein [Halarcobacter sp.]